MLALVDWAGRAHPLPPAGPQALGRATPWLRLADPKVSRVVCRVSCSGEHGVLISPTTKPVYVRKTGSEQVQTLQGLQEVRVGDTIYLLKLEDEFLYGLTVAHVEPASTDGKSYTATPLADASRQPSAERRLEASPRQSTQDKGSAQSPRQDADAEAAPDPLGDSSSGIFAGLHFVVWAQTHMSRLMAKAKDAGACVQRQWDPHVTHVIVDRGMTREEAESKLAQIHNILDKDGELDGAHTPLPGDVQFVEPQFVTDSLARQVLLDAERYHIDLGLVKRQPHAKRRRTEGAVQPCTPTEGILAKILSAGCPEVVTDQQPGPGLTGGLPPALVPTQQSRELSDPDTLRDIAKHIVNLTGLGDSSPRAVGSQEHTEDWGPVWVPATSPRAHPYDGRQVTGGTSGLPWGTGNQWVEPWNEAAARETLLKLDQWWHRKDDTASPVAKPPAGSLCDTSPELVNADSQCVADGAQVPRNGVCAHAACAAKSFCIVAHLQEVHDNYRPRVDQFRIKAIERAIRTVTTHPEPLVSGAQCEALGIGVRSAEKLREIVETGTLRRNDILAQDAEHRLVSQFMEVWGTGSTTAERWVRDGCRLLDDIRKRTDLTEQQRCGLKYFKDFQQRVPRDEAAVVERIVREAMLDLLDCRKAPDADLLHVRVVGSYIRGKPWSSDIDFMIIPPPSTSGMPSGPLMDRLVAHLRTTGLLTEDMVSVRHKSGGGGGATWLGAARPPNSPFVRRIDLKLYPPTLTAYAVNYFTGSGAFVRALRYWARCAPDAVQLAARAADGANGFLLSDYGLFPLARRTATRRGHERGASPEQPAERRLGPSLPAACETDIFHALGLSYVPPHMRFFGDNYQ